LNLKFDNDNLSLFKNQMIPSNPIVIKINSIIELSGKKKAIIVSNIVIPIIPKNEVKTKLRVSILRIFLTINPFPKLIANSEKTVSRMKSIKKDCLKISNLSVLNIYMKKFTSERVQIFYPLHDQLCIQSHHLQHRQLQRLIQDFS